MYQALYRQYRPEVFEDVIGQDTIVRILKSQIEKNKLVHAYLFCGTRGTGKTTTARLLAKAVNCLSDNKPCGVCENCKSIQSGNFIDLIEIDAASNNGVNDIRELREGVNFPPAIGKTKVYIIDEVHALTKEAFNAFLKTLEEPPENVMFILATTEPNKLPSTILSRCLRMDFKRVREEELALRMREIVEARGIIIDDESLKLVAVNADGSVRDGLTLLEQCIAGRDGQITREDILDSLGAVGEEVYIDIVNDILMGNPSDCIITLNKALDQGRDARQLVNGLMNHYRNLLLTKYIKDPKSSINMSYENIERIQSQSSRMDLWQIDEAVMELAETSKYMQTTTQPRIIFEMALVKLAASRMSPQARETVQAQPYIAEKKINLSKGDNKVYREDEHLSAEKIDKDIPPWESDNKENISEKDIENEKQGSIDIDMRSLWDEVTDVITEERPSLMLLKHSYPIALTSTELIFSKENRAFASMVENNMKDITDIIQSVCGRSLSIRLDDKAKEKQVDDEEVKAIFKNFSGMNVELNIK